MSQWFGFSMPQAASRLDFFRYIAGRRGQINGSANCVIASLQAFIRLLRLLGFNFTLHGVHMWKCFGTSCQSLVFWLFAFQTSTEQPRRDFGMA